MPDHLVAFIDDNAEVREANAQTLELAGLSPLVLDGPVEALKRIDRTFAGVVVSDVRMPDLDGFELLERLHGVDPDLPVILVTGHGDVAMAVRAMKSGAYDFLTKPFAAEDLLAGVRRAIEKRRLVLENRALRREAEFAAQEGPMIGVSSAMQRLREQIRRLALSDAHVLIQGESGVGKELAASMLHRLSPRRANPLTVIDCAALGEAAEIELFGLESGGANLRRRTGLLESAHRATIYLSEIEALSLTLQAKLVRVLETKALTLPGPQGVRSVDVRVVASTRIDLEAAARGGAFRQDLYHGLAVGQLKIPPLRQRREDIPILYQHFFGEATRSSTAGVSAIDTSVRRRLADYDWPGNVRELMHYAQRVAIGADDVEDPLAQATTPSTAALPERVAAFEADLVREALSMARGDVRSTLALLSIPKKTFYDKLAKYSIDISRFRDAP